MVSAVLEEKYRSFAFMKKVLLPCSFSEIGGKDNQEDRIYPSPEQVKPDQKFFILCDGMGGHDCGEVASETVSRTLGEYFERHPVERADADYFNRALEFAYACLDTKDTGSEKKMGTTMTCLYFNPDGFLAAHIGDSRIYQFRDGKIIFQTQDHSLVNDLLRAGEITKDEAENYPRKNVITRAMQPNSRRSKADIYISRDILPGDFFFMCCDGVLERVNNDRLCGIFGEKTSPGQKLAAIKAECDKGTKDNYTCWLIPAQGKVEKTASSTHSSTKRRGWIFPLVLTVLVFLAGLLLGRHIYKERDVGNKQMQEQVDGQVADEPVDNSFLKAEI